MIKITCISDLHGYIPLDLEPGDLLIVAGDLTGNDKEYQYFEIFEWIDRQPFKEKILIAGNHDTRMEMENYPGPRSGEFHYLNNLGIELFGLKIWGIPHSLLFDGINPLCVAYCGSEFDLKGICEDIPDDIDILISHGPAWGVLDKTDRGENVGSYALLTALERIKPKLLVTAHIHESYGTLSYKHQGPNTLCVNASYVNERYNPVNKPITVLLEKNDNIL